jgi:hypothetical protein
MAWLEKLEHLNLDGNPLNPALRSVYDQQGLEGLRAYLRSLAEAEPLYETKLILVGEGGVGKTTLRKAMLGQEPREGEPTTHGIGIDIRRLLVPHPEIEGVDIQFNIWDAGGQEVYRGTTQLFFSANAIYLLVWEPRRGVQQSQVEDWLRLIRMRVGEKARVIVVSTHSRTGARIALIDKPVFLRDYGSMIVGFHEVDSMVNDLETGEPVGVAELKEMVAQAAAGLEQMGKDFNRDWRAARDEILNIEHPHIPYSDLAAICERHGLNAVETQTLAGLMHDQGYIVYYGEDERLKERVVLQPEWLTRAIGCVLEDRVTQQMDGILPDHRLREIWWDEPVDGVTRFEPELYPFFLWLMAKYDILYRLETGDASLIAQQVPQVRPDLPWLPEDAPAPDRRRTKLMCVMDEVPPGLVSWMIVRTSAYACERTDSEGKVHRLHWQKGMFLRYKQHSEAMLELRGREFHIYVEATWPEYFGSVLRQTLETLLADNWPGLRGRYRFAVPCTEHLDDGPCSGRFDIDALRRFLEEGDETIRCQVCFRRQSITELLFGIEAEDLLSELVKVEEKLDLQTQRLYQRLKDMESQISSYVATTMSTLKGEGRYGPRLFTLEPVEGEWRSLAVQRCRLQLWCEAEDCQHPVLEPGKGIYEFEAPIEWLQDTAPYASLVVGILQTLLPMVTPAVDAYFGTDTIKQGGIRERLDQMVTVTGDLLEVRPRHLARPQPEMLTEAERSGILALHTLLREMDPNMERQGLTRVVTYTGDYLWLCARHCRDFAPEIPDLIDSPATQPARIKLTADILLIHSPEDQVLARRIEQAMVTRGLTMKRESSDKLSDLEQQEEIRALVRSARTTAFLISESRIDILRHPGIRPFLRELEESGVTIIAVQVSDIKEPPLTEFRHFVDLTYGLRKFELDEWEYLVTGIRPDKVKGFTWIDWLYGEGYETDWAMLKPAETDIQIRPVMLRLRNIRVFQDTGVIKLIREKDWNSQLTLLLA